MIGFKMNELMVGTHKFYDGAGSCQWGRVKDAKQSGRLLYTKGGCFMCRLFFSEHEQIQRALR